MKNTATTANRVEFVDGAIASAFLLSTDLTARIAELGTWAEDQQAGWVYDETAADYPTITDKAAWLDACHALADTLA